MAFCFPPIQQIGFNEVPREKLNLVSCAQNVSRLLAGSIGTPSRSPLWSGAQTAILTHSANF